MKKYGILSEIRRKRKWQNLGQQIHRYKNLLNRQFSADKPNSKWVTDISYIQTKEGVLYLSMIRDLYDNSIVAYKTATQQTINLVLDTIRLAIAGEHNGAEIVFFIIFHRVLQPGQIVIGQIVCGVLHHFPE